MKSENGVVTAPSGPVLGMQVMDFKQNFGEKAMGGGNALSYGFSCGNPVKIWINDELVHSHKNQKLFIPKEISYNCFIFQDTLNLNFKKGANKILLKSVGERDQWIFFLRAIIHEGDENSDMKFSLQSIAPKITASKWLCIGVFPGNDLDKIFSPELEFRNFYSYLDQNYY